MAYHDPSIPRYGPDLTTVSLRSWEDALVVCRQGWPEEVIGRRRMDSDLDGRREREENLEGKNKVKSDDFGSWRKKSCDSFKESREFKSDKVDWVNMEDPLFSKHENMGSRHMFEKKWEFGESSGVKMNPDRGFKENEFFQEDLEEVCYGLINEETGWKNDVKMVKVEEVKEDALSVKQDYMVELPDDHDEGSLEMVPVFRNHYLEVLDHLRRVKLKQEAEDPSSPKSSKRVKVFEQYVSCKARVSYYAKRESSSKSRKGKKKAEKDKQKIEEICLEMDKLRNGDGDKSSFGTDPVKEGLIFEARRNVRSVLKEARGSGGWPSTATKPT